MRRIKEVLRLKYELGLGQRQIARSCSIGQATVNDYLRRAAAAGIQWPLTEEWDDDRIDRELFGSRTQPSAPPSQRTPPDFPSIHNQPRVEAPAISGRDFNGGDRAATLPVGRAGDPDRRRIPSMPDTSPAGHADRSCDCAAL
jgi:hypothetical protein